MSERLLEQEEFDALKSGDEVIITWCGGNGPHRYRVSKECGLSVIYGKYGEWIGNPCCKIDKVRLASNLP